MYNLVGQRVLDLLNEELPMGRYQLSVNAGQLASGTYMAVMRAGDHVSTRKMLLVK